MPNVTITPPATIKVQIGQAVRPTITEIAYGTRTIKSASDLIFTGARTGDAIVYDASTNGFKTSNFIGVTGIRNIDGGSY